MSSHEKVIREHINTFISKADQSLAAAQTATDPKQHYDRALALLNSAKQWEKNKTLLEALDKRIAAITPSCSSSTPHPALIAMAPAKAVAKKGEVPPAAAAPPPPSSPATEDQGGAPPDETPKDDRWVVKGACNVRFDDIAGLENVKQMIMDALVYSKKFKNLYAETAPIKGIMLYGPSGTGKTQLVRAMATEMDWTMLSADSAKVFSMWQGESEKSMKDLFDVARSRKPCIVFIDEADGILGEEGGNGNSKQNDVKRRVATQFQTAMDGIETDADEKDLVVVIATNFPWLLPTAVKRRFQKQIEIPLPDAAARAALVRIALRGRTHALTDTDIDAIVAATDRYSGADIQRLAGEVFLRPIHRVQQATHFLQREDGKWIPADAADPDAVECSWKSLTDDELARPPVVMADWFDCLRLIKPTNEPDMLAAYDDYTKKLGTRY